MRSKWVCKTCLRNLKGKKIPRCAIVNKMGFPMKPKVLDLTELEWRLVSPRLVFQKLHEAPRGKQKKICGNIVNVPANVINTVTALPRLCEQAGTIKVQLKRKLKYKSYTLSQNIRPTKVFMAAEWLTKNGSLFKQEGIVLNKEWIDENICLGGEVQIYNPEVPSTSSYNEVNVFRNTDVHLSEHYFCLDCGRYISTFSDLDGHMQTVHKATDDNDDSFCYRYNILLQSDYEEDVIFVCSICNCCEREEKLLRDHMTFVHDIPSEEFVRKTFASSESVPSTVYIHKMLDLESVLLVEVYKSGYMPRSSVNMSVFVAIPDCLCIGVSPSRNLLSEENLTLPEGVASTGLESDNWDESEHESDQCAGAMDTMLISPDFVEGSECTQSVFSVAPAEGNKPLSIFKDKYCEELAYPRIFCGKARADNSERDVPVYYSDICKSELRRSDRRASECVENLFFKVKKLQMKILLGKCQVALRKHKTKGRKITAGELKKDRTLDKLCHAGDGYRFLRALRGSPPYFEKAKKDLFAMIRQLGPATLFCSFSAAETKWSHLLRILGKLIDKKDYSDDELNNLTWEQKTRLIQSDPVMCARHFDYQVQQLMVKFLLSEVAPLGKVEDWFYRVEFQQRGSPHIHMLLWIDGAPKFGVESDEDVTNFIDRVITCSRGAKDETLSDLVVRQLHSHSQSCKKRGQLVCRFNFPQPPIKSTVILYPLGDDFSAVRKEKYKNEFRKLNDKLNSMKDGEDISFDGFLQKFKLSEEEYLLVIRSSLLTPTVFLRRNPDELRVNGYNKGCLLAWRANMDIQFVLDVYACAMYIVSYISKAQRGMSELLRAACDEAKNGNLTIKQQVRDIGNKFLNGVEISAQEAVYIALQLPMRRSSRDVIFIPSSPPDERIQLLKSFEEIKTLEDDSEEIETGGLLKRYAERPHSVENVTLADWAAFYDSCKVKYSCVKSRGQDTDGLLLETQDDDNDEDDVESYMNKSMKTKQSTKMLKRRLKARIIRSVWFNKDVDSEKHYRELLFLFTPWRNESRDIDNFESYEQRCRELSEQIRVQLDQYSRYRSEIDEALLHMREDHSNENMWNLVAPNTQHTEGIDTMNGCRNADDNEDNVDESYDLSDDLGIPSSSLVQEHASSIEMSDDEYRETVRSLNNEQLVFFYHILHLIRTSSEPFYCFLSGGAGCGKSHLTKTLYQATIKCLNTNVGDYFQNIRALLLAPSGKAAYNIRGCTIHRALGKSACRKLTIYQKLDSSRLNSLRNQLGGLRIIFLDETSMCGNAMLNVQINKRLQDIKGIDTDFGGVSIVAIEDLFQLPPMYDGYIFDSLKGNYGALAMQHTCGQGILLCMSFAKL